MITAIDLSVKNEAKQKQADLELLIHITMT